MAASALRDASGGTPAGVREMYEYSDSLKSNTRFQSISALARDPVRTLGINTPLSTASCPDASPGVLTRREGEGRQGGESTTSQVSHADTAGHHTATCMLGCFKASANRLSRCFGPQDYIKTCMEVPIYIQ